MLKSAICILALVSAATCDEARRHRIEDPFAALDRHITHTLAYHYLWPWDQLIKAAAAIDAEEHLEEPKILSDDKKFEINMNVKRFKPDELRVKVKNRYILVEGHHKENNDNRQKFMANHFVQRFVLPLGSKQEEVTAILKENGILSITAPKHELPPPPPEREVPIEVRLPEKTEVPEKTESPVKTETPVKEETTTEKKEVSPVVTSTATPLEQLDLVEATTHVGKIRKKELKTTPKTTKDNEVTKGGEGNGLDYMLIESEE
ncbi:alpha-crystallin B chain-like [Ostrinia furnacalis]|uniref:alpha-crystallin B chain-like n=1 Tax=Ostrinia furnacalis TaxID=93504 RepID=UPI00103EC8FE|nr:alpha-crystallin B chain-like [Ostrinia furnacalis]